MSSPPSAVADSTAGTGRPASQADAIRALEPRNFWALTLYSVMLRVGWIFKTESVIMPAFLDAIAGAGWIRGFLPVLNRLGQSVPPMCLADRLRHAPIKNRWLVTTSLLMSGPFLALSGIWALLEAKRQPWLPPLFLLLYLLFFSFTGLNQLAFGTVQGKLIRPHRRGRLLGWGGIGGSIGAVSAALLLLRPWLALPNNAGFAQVFLFNGAAFAVAGLILLACREPAEAPRNTPHVHVADHFRQAWRVYREDREFRRAATVAILFISALLLFPHYQWLGRTRLGTTNVDLIWWVVTQNIAVGIASPVLGMIADHRGNRLAVRIAVLASACTPLVAVLLASPLVADGRRWYWITFVLLGLCPVTMRTIANYTLELVEADQHPRYLSTMTVCFAVPFVLSPAVGWLIDTLPYQYVFAAVSCVIAAGGVMTWRMSEPRHRISTDES